MNCDQWKERGDSAACGQDRSCGIISAESEIGRTVSSSAATTLLVGASANAEMSKSNRTRKIWRWYRRFQKLSVLFGEGWDSEGIDDKGYDYIQPRITSCIKSLSISG